MKIGEIKSDIIKLRCNICQNFLKLILKDGWQKIIYKKAKDEIKENNRYYKDKYKDMYGKMREKGIENYSVDDMDVTIISELIHTYKKNNSIFSVDISINTKRAIEQLTEDRNLQSHSNENEDDEELYVQALLNIFNLKKFIKTVDYHEMQIEDEKLTQFVEKWIQEVNKLNNIVRDEFCIFIKTEKEIDQNIKRILNSFVWLKKIKK